MVQWVQYDLNKHWIAITTHIQTTANYNLYILFYPWLEDMDKLMPDP